MSNCHRFKDFCQLALRSKVEAPSSSEILGRYSMGNSTALMLEKQPAITYQMVSELCNSNGLHFNGFSFVTINELQTEQVANNKPVMYTNVLYYFAKLYR